MRRLQAAGVWLQLRWASDTSHQELTAPANLHLGGISSRMWWPPCQRQTAKVKSAKEWGFPKLSSGQLKFFQKIVIREAMSKRAGSPVRGLLISQLAARWQCEQSQDASDLPSVNYAPLLAAVLALRSAAVRMRCDLLRGVAAGAGMEHGECEALSPLLPMQHRACHRPSRCPVVQTM